MKLLLDTCVLSEIRHPKGSPAVKEAILRRADEDLYLSALTIGEIRTGIVRLADPLKKQGLAAWLHGLQGQFSDRILGIDAEVASLWGELDAEARRRGLIVPAVDGLIAATAIRHGLAVATRNNPHFAIAGARLFNPWVDY